MSHPVIPSASWLPHMQPQTQLHQNSPIGHRLHDYPVEVADQISREMLLMRGKSSGPIPAETFRKVEEGVYKAQPYLR
jgi:hypothetical protein